MKWIIVDDSKVFRIDGYCHSLILLLTKPSLIQIYLILFFVHDRLRLCTGMYSSWVRLCTSFRQHCPRTRNLKSTLTAFISAGQVATSSTYEQAIVIQRTGVSQCLNTRISSSSGTSHENSRLDRSKIASAKPLQLTHLKGPILWESWNGWCQTKNKTWDDWEKREHGRCDSQSIGFDRCGLGK